MPVVFKVYNGKIKNGHIIGEGIVINNNPGESKYGDVTIAEGSFIKGKLDGPNCRYVVHTGTKVVQQTGTFKDGQPVDYVEVVIGRYTPSRTSYVAAVTTYEAGVAIREKSSIGPYNVFVTADSAEQVSSIVCTAV